MTPDLIAAATAYIRAVERGADAETLEAFYHPEIESEEVPNRLVPEGALRTIADLRRVNAAGRGMFASQRYEIVNAMAAGDQVMLETVWTGTLAVPLGGLRPGQVLAARSAQLFAYRDGRIRRHRSYDSFSWQHA